MKKLYQFATVAAVFVAAANFVIKASANAFAWLGLSYVPTDNGNQARADLQRRIVDEAPGSLSMLSSF